MLLPSKKQIHILPYQENKKHKQSYNLHKKLYFENRKEMEIENDVSRCHA